MFVFIGYEGLDLIHFQLDNHKVRYVVFMTILRGDCESVLFASFFPQRTLSPIGVLCKLYIIRCIYIVYLLHIELN